MSQTHKWMIRNILTKYCRLVVPPPKAIEGDQLGKWKCRSNLIFIYYWICFQYLIFADGVYEKQMSVCPPPLTMVMFSIIEILFFLVDVIHFQ